MVTVLNCTEYVSIAFLFCDGARGVTVHSRYQKNAAQVVHDFMKTVWPQAYK